MDEENKEKDEEGESGKEWLKLVSKHMRILTQFLYNTTIPPASPLKPQP